MIDRERRDSLAELLRQLCSGRITNDQFENGASALLTVYGTHGDRAIKAVIKQAWYLYSDLREYRLTDKDALHRITKREVARWIVFLHSDFEYKWPVSACLLGAYRWLLRLIFWVSHNIRAWVERDPDVWPFSRQVDYEHARRSPRLLSGTRVIRE